MVTEWLCPHCGREFYSANESRNKQHVACANCGEQVDNHCFERKFEEASPEGEPVIHSSIHPVMRWI